ncbi:hypothetical protein EV426DRAFT_142299 [Tirmania nivea]|nr:hypothetical protein EV426DRAFT_142299 [Tirmania nivea]
MTTPLLALFNRHPPSSTHTHPSTILTLSQHASPFLAAASAHTDTPETWLLYENLLLACLRSRDDSSARTCLERLTARFGAANERVMALRGLYDEATASSAHDLESILLRYEQILADDPTNVPIHKRLISLLASLRRLPRAAAGLTSLLAVDPTDAEAWAELAALYFSQGMHWQALFCLEEVILIHPQAYNVYARMGELSYILAAATPDCLAAALKYYLRSIELCEGYLRGYYGLVLVCGRLLKQKEEGEGAGRLQRDKVRRLYEGGRRRLAEIVQRAGEKGWEGYDEGEVEAARRLLQETGDVDT